MKVWLVWTGEYSSSSVVGVYSTLALAEAAAALYSDGYVEDVDGREVDAGAAFVRAGMQRWSVQIRCDDGAVIWTHADGIGTGQPSTTNRMTGAVYLPTGRITRPPVLTISCDARDREQAIKIAGDERAKHLAAVDPSGDYHTGNPTPRV